MPLSPLHPKNILLYYANDTNASLLITSHTYADLMQKVAKNTTTPIHVLDDKLQLKTTQKFPKSKTDLYTSLPLSFYSSSNALIIYTSGSTGNPKGVVLTHKNINFQINSLLEAWKWSDKDTILHTLPLHHVHGIVNALLCPLYIGAKTIILPKFDPHNVWAALLGIGMKPEDGKVNMYMAVPTIYAKLIEEYEKAFKGDPKMVAYIKNTMINKIRLMVSGSAPLPAPVYQKWLDISGQRLLERFGMTEIGMALSNLYEGDREPGYVGVPLPGVSVRLVDTDDKSGKNETILESTNNKGKINTQTNNKYIKDKALMAGELLVKSDGVFKEYFNRPDATQKEFTVDKWFKTGDICGYSLEKKKFQILGRKSVDIIKSGGYKISALEVETVLLSHPDIKDCAVVGIKDEKYGQVVAAIIVLNQEKKLTLEDLKVWLADKIPTYVIPRRVEVVKEILKNSMGKVNKKELQETIFGPDK